LAQKKNKNKAISWNEMIKKKVYFKIMMNSETWFL
jgi:hypothetical protein